MRGTTKFTIILIVSALAGVGTLVLPSYFLIQLLQPQGFWQIAVTIGLEVGLILPISVMLGFFTFIIFLKLFE